MDEPRKAGRPRRDARKDLAPSDEVMLKVSEESVVRAQGVLKSLAKAIKRDPGNSRELVQEFRLLLPATISLDQINDLQTAIQAVQGRMEKLEMDIRSIDRQIEMILGMPKDAASQISIPAPQGF